MLWKREVKEEFMEMKQDWQVRKGKLNWIGNKEDYGLIGALFNVIKDEFTRIHPI